MLMTTDWLTLEERQRILAAIPWHDELVQLAQFISGAINPDSANAFDVAFLKPGHIRAGMVALEEGTDTLLEAAMDLCDSIAIMAVFERTSPRRPFSPDAALSRRAAWLSRRRSRAALENAAVRAVSASDHLANAHVRLAWEMNAATDVEARRCGFDPHEQQTRSWISSRFLRDRLSALPTDTSVLLPYFKCNESFAAFVRSPATAELFELRHQAVHRERPEFRELPAAGRATGWSEGRINLMYAPDPDAPTFADARSMIGDAVVAMLPWIHSLWDTSREWLASLNVRLYTEDGSGRTHNTFGIGHRPAREQRDPSPYLLRTAPLADTSTP